MFPVGPRGSPLPNPCSCSPATPAPAPAPEARWLPSSCAGRRTAGSAPAAAPSAVWPLCARRWASYLAAPLRRCPPPVTHKRSAARYRRTRYSDHAQPRGRRQSHDRTADRWCQQFELGLECHTMQGNAGAWHVLTVELLYMEQPREPLYTLRDTRTTLAQTQTQRTCR
jgi:hypothetical protein